MNVVNNIERNELVLNPIIRFVKKAKMISNIQQKSGTNHQSIYDKSVTDFVPFPQDTTKLSKIKDFSSYHLKYGWFRYLLGYTLTVVVLFPVLYGGIMPIIFYLLAITKIPINMYSFIMLSFILIGLIGILGALPVRYITKGYIHYRYMPLPTEQKKKLFRKYQYLYVTPFLSIITFITMFITSYFM